MFTVIQVLMFLLTVLRWLVIANVILSLLFAFNVLNYSNTGARSVLSSLERLLQPLYRPFNKLIPIRGNIDWAPFFLLITISVLQIILGNVAYSV